MNQIKYYYSDLELFYIFKACVTFEEIVEVCHALKSLRDQDENIKLKTVGVFASKRTQELYARDI